MSHSQSHTKSHSNNPTGKNQYSKQNQDEYGSNDYDLRSKQNQNQNQSGSQNDSGNQEFQPGDKVSFNIGNNANTGTVQEMITEEKSMDGKTFHASEEHPQVLIEHDNTGRIFNRNPDKLQTSGDNQGSQMETETA